MNEMISYKDMCYFFQKNAKKLCKIFLLSCFLALPFTFLRYPIFMAKGGFQDSAPSSTLEEQLKFLPSSMQKELSYSGKALIWMKSRPVLERAIKMTGAQLVPAMPRYKLAYLSHFASPLFQKIVDLPLHISEFNTKNKGIKTVKITPMTQNTVRIEAMGELKEFSLPAYIDLKSLSFYMVGDIDQTLVGQTLYYHTLGLHKAGRLIKKRLTLSQSDQDRSALQIILLERSKKRAETLLNAIVFAYQTHLEEKNRNSLIKQLSYCTVRQKQLMAETLETMKGNFERPASSSFVDGISQEAMLKIQKELHEHALASISSLTEGIKAKLSSIESVSFLTETGYARSKPSSFNFPTLSILIAAFVTFVYALYGLLKFCYTQKSAHISQSS